MPLLIDTIAFFKQIGLVRGVKNPRERAEGENSESVPRDVLCSCSLSFLYPEFEVALEIHVLVNRIIVELAIVDSLFEWLLVIGIIENIHDTDSVLNVLELICSAHN